LWIVKIDANELKSVYNNHVMCAVASICLYTRQEQFNRDDQSQLSKKRNISFTLHHVREIRII
jgi:hypothetical protein